MSGWPFEPPISPMEARVRERLPEPPGWISNPSGTAFAPLHGPVAHRPARDRAGRDEPFDASSFSKNRERLLAYDVSRAFFAEVVAEERQRRLLRRPLHRGRHAAGGVGLAEELLPARRSGERARDAWWADIA